MYKQLLGLAFGGATMISLARASETAPPPPAEPSGSNSGVATKQAASTAKPDSRFVRVWRCATWYDNDANPILQKFQFTGRYQYDYAWVDQNNYDDWDARRCRMGGKATLFHDFIAHAEAELYFPGDDSVYQRLTDAYLAWSQSKTLELTLGKQSAAFTMDGSTSSKELLAIDRSNLANNLWFTEEYIPGVSANGEVEAWSYFLGVFSAGAENKEFGEFDGGAFVLATFGYNFAKQLDLNKARLNLNYVYNTGDEPDSFTRPLEQVASVNFDFDAGKWGFRADVSGGTGVGSQSDLWGGMIMPYYNLTEKLQAVARYTFIESRDDNGIRFARYENQVVSGQGDQYQEFYAGLNYYFYKHKLKVQSGGQYAIMRDHAADGGAYSGWAWTTGFRVSW